MWLGQQVCSMASAYVYTVHVHTYALGARCSVERNLLLIVCTVLYCICPGDVCVVQHTQPPMLWSYVYMFKVPQLCSRSTVQVVAPQQDTHPLL